MRIQKQHHLQKEGEEGLSNLAMHIEAPKCNPIQSKTFFVGEKKASMGQQSVKNPM